MRTARGDLSEDDGNLIHLAARFAPSITGDREVGLFWAKLARYQAKTGKRPTPIVAHRLARQLFVDLVRATTRRRHQKGGVVIGNGRFLKAMRSLDEPPKDHGESEMRLGEVLADPNAPLPADGDCYLRPVLAQCLFILPDRERDILLSYVHGDEAMHEIGARHGVSEARICQIVNRSLAKLREYIGRVFPELAAGRRAA